MKKQLVYLLALVALATVFVGCDDDDNGIVSRTPAAPQGVYTITGDHAVYLYWNGVYDNSVTEYIVWRSLNATTGYTEIDRVDAESNPNLDLLIYEYVDGAVANGTTYWYAVSSVNTSGLVSDLSAEDAFDTPRPEGQITLFPYQVDSTLAGFNLEAAARVPYNSVLADVYIDIFDGILYINAANENTDLQDMGFTSTFDDISYAPDAGWSELGYVEVIPGHTYVIWTAEDHYAKMRVGAINPSGSIVFQWAFQVDPQNPELVPPRPVHSSNYLNKQAVSQQ
jgi:hypothetical protein